MIEQCTAIGSLGVWIIRACWAVFAVVWIAGSLYNRRHAAPVAQRSDRRWLLFVFGVAGVVAVAPHTTWRVFHLCEGRVQVIGAVLLIVGTAFALWARVVLGTMWSSVPLQRTGHELRTTGPYAITRHPIYTAIISMLIGTALLDGVGVWLPFLLAAVSGLVFKLRAEERLMRAAFGDAYREYAKRVPALVPWPRR